MSFIIYVLYYDETSRLKAESIYGKYKWARPIFNPTTKYLESGFMSSSCTCLSWLNVL